MSLVDLFSSFCNNLKIQDSGEISVRYKNITKQLNIDFWNTSSDALHSLYVGSYGRNTAIRSIRDVDVIFQLPDSDFEKYNKYDGNCQSALLQAVNSSVEKIYSSAAIGDGKKIIVPFKDGFSFEIVPAFINADKSYTFPDSGDGGNWRITNPKSEIDAISERNKKCNGNLVRLCRMMRAWKDNRDVPIGGLLIDTLAYQFIENWEYQNKSVLYYDFMCRDFFKWMSEQDLEQTYWKAPGSGQDVYGKGLFQSKAKRCYNISLEALEYENTTPKQEWFAKQKWTEIFGTAFPI